MDSIDASEKSSCSQNSHINDIRSPPSFKGISFSKYKKTDVRNQLIENMKKGKIEPACYWTCELICAGHFMEVWEIILYYVGKHIHLANPKLIIYLEMRFEMFRNIISQGHYINEIDLRNDKNIRQLFAEIISIITLSNKKHSFEPIKIVRSEEFDMTQMTERLKAPSMSYAEPIVNKEDPKELYIAINEFSYNISKDRRNMATASYWIEWIIEFDAICKKRKEPCLCVCRSHVPVEKKYQQDIIWIIWDSMFHYCNILENSFIDKLLKSLFQVFCIKYTTASCKKRRNLLYFAVALLTETIPTNIELVQNKLLVQNVVLKIDEIYKQIKKNEESPNTEYLFANMEKQNNFEKSILKMQLMNTMDTLSRPIASNNNNESNDI
jgi:hypothetical protein